MEPRIDVGVPKQFGMTEVILANLYCILPLGIIGACGLGAGLVLGIAGGIAVGPTVGLIVFLIAQIVGIGAIVYFFPTVQANPYVRSLVQGRSGRISQDTITYICQATLDPRLYSGLRGFLEDADDIGWLEVTGEGVIFNGDHIKLSLPFDSIDRFTTANCGYRMLWLGGKRMRVYTSAFDGIQSVEFLEREANTIPTSRRLAGEIVYAIEYGRELARGQAPEAQ